MPGQGHRQPRRSGRGRTRRRVSRRRWLRALRHPRLRAGGAGIPAFYTPAGVGTQVAGGGLPWRYAPDGSIAVASAPKEMREFAGQLHVMEECITTDYALVRAWRGDRHGNLVFCRAAADFDPLTATAGRITIAEVEELVEPGELDPDTIHLPGIFVQRVILLTQNKPPSSTSGRGRYVPDGVDPRPDGRPWQGDGHRAARRLLLRRRSSRTAPSHSPANGASTASSPTSASSTSPMPASP
ncbi:hypothetical protein CJD44_14060 [Streptomyces sp. alain-838]|nr:hypothetical protein CJD44_14060 [Streptomyces sp. alain-838]